MIIPKKQIRKIAVFRALQLGDLLCAIPAIRALRHAYPQARITLLGLPWAVSLLQRFPDYFDDFIHFPGYPGLPEQPFEEAAFACFINRMKEERFDLLLQMQGNGTVVNPLMYQLHARNVAGFHNAESHVNSPLFVNYPNAGPEVKRHLYLMQHLGIPLQGSYMEFPVQPSDEAEVKKLFLPVIPRSYVIVHPGSRGAWRQWFPHYFAFAADTCIEKGYTVIVTGTEEERDITREVLKCMRHPAVDLTGQTSLGAIGLLIRDAYMLIANCTGVSHIASATETPSVIISMDGEPERRAPVNRQIHKVIDWTTEPHAELVWQAMDSLFHQQSAATA